MVKNLINKSVLVILSLYSLLILVQFIMYGLGLQGIIIPLIIIGTCVILFFVQKKKWLYYCTVASFFMGLLFLTLKLYRLPDIGPLIDPGFYLYEYDATFLLFTKIKFYTGFAQYFYQNFVALALISYIFSLIGLVLGIIAFQRQVRSK